MASLARSVTSAVVAALQAADGTGSWHFDLSDTGRVVIGEPLRPEMVPQVFVSFDGFGTEDGPPLGMYERLYRVAVIGFVAGSDSLGDRVLEAADLADDIATAIEADRLLGLGASGVRDLRTEGTAFSGDELGLEGYGVAVVNAIIRAVVRTGS